MRFLLWYFILWVFFVTIWLAASFVTLVFLPVDPGLLRLAAVVNIPLAIALVKSDEIPPHGRF